MLDECTSDAWHSCHGTVVLRCGVRKHFETFIETFIQLKYKSKVVIDTKEGNLKSLASAAPVVMNMCGSCYPTDPLL